MEKFVCLFKPTTTTKIKIKKSSPFKPSSFPIQIAFEICRNQKPQKTFIFTLVLIQYLVFEMKR